MPEEIVMGRHAVLEALRGSRDVKRLLVTGSHGKPDATHGEAVLLARARGVSVHTVGRGTLDRLGSHHQGIAAEVAAFPYQELEGILAAIGDRRPPPLLVLLDSVQDPQNLGTLMRTAAALGADAVIVPKHRAANVTPAVERASAGAVSRLAVGRVTNMARAVETLRKAGVWVYGLDARASARYDQVDLTGPVALVVGSEGDGLSKLVAEKCDRLIRVPMAGAMDSLNVAVAGSIVLAEVFRQRERAGQAVEGALPPMTPSERPARVAPPPPAADDELEALADTDADLDAEDFVVRAVRPARNRPAVAKPARRPSSTAKARPPRVSAPPTDSRKPLPGRAARKDEPMNRASRDTGPHETTRGFRGGDGYRPPPKRDDSQSGAGRRGERGVAPPTRDDTRGARPTDRGKPTAEKPASGPKRGQGRRGPSIPPRRGPSRGPSRGPNRGGGRRR